MLKTAVAPYRLLVAKLAWLGLALQYWLVMTGDIGPGPIWRTLNFFSYFTILTNTLAALAMTLPWLAPRTAAGQFFSEASVRTAIAGYIIVVCAIYYLVLQQLWEPQAWDLVADVTLHYVVPVLFVVDWLLFVPKGAMKLNDTVAWLGYPVAYLAWTFIHGALSGFYPYPFIDVVELGYTRVLMNVVGIVVAFFVLGLLLVGLDRLIGRVRLAPTN